MATKKTVTKKTVTKKAAAKKVKTKKSEPQKTGARKLMPEKISLLAAPGEAPASADCKCMQKKPNGKFYWFKLQEGRWVQALGTPFPTKEICEDACC